MGRVPLGQIQRRQEPGRLPCSSRLLEGIRYLDQLCFFVRCAEYGQADWQLVYVAHGDGDVRVARHRGKLRGRQGVLVAVDQIGNPGGAVGGANNRV